MTNQLIAAGTRAKATPTGACRLYLIRHGTTTMNVENRYRAGGISRSTPRAIRTQSTLLAASPRSA